MKLSNITLGIGMILICFFLFTQSLYSVEYFMSTEKPNNGKIPMFFKCDNNRMVKIIDLGGNRFQFYSVGGKDIMERKTALEVAAYVCKYYLRTK